ncbi:MAG: RagB/SusD family nutrient uptake outer membrane protein, partial [Bacteroidales bacterium]|nr:RagB/SusD family nutrient uptake outer membrane protein [Bacteroidales bacterium]
GDTVYICDMQGFFSLVPTDTAVVKADGSFEFKGECEGASYRFLVPTHKGSAEGLGMADFILENAKELEGGFEYLYYMSTACNSALALIENAEAEGVDPFPEMTTADKALVKRIKGELLFMRAFTYWNLARTWCPPYDSKGSNDSKHIVVYRTNESDSDALKNATLSTVKEVYDYIVADLKDAIAILPDAYYTGDNNKRMRANKYAAEALLARVLFYMGNFSEAKTYIDDVIRQTDLYALDTDLVAPFNKTSSSPTSKEVIWEIVYSDDSDRYDRNPGIMQYAAYNGHATKMCGYAAFSLSYYAMEKIGWLDKDHKLTAEAQNDLRFQNLYIYHPGNDAYPDPAIYIFKYFRGATPTTNGRRAPRPLIRLSDLYLMRAQINLMAGSSAAAAADVNVVRERAGLQALSTVTEADIENERIKVSGSVEDIRECYASARLFAAPMVSGSGLQNKLLEAMAMQMP